MLKRVKTLFVDDFYIDVRRRKTFFALYNQNTVFCMGVVLRKTKTLYIRKKSCTLFFRTWITYTRSEIPQVKSEIVLSIWNASLNEHLIAFCKIILEDKIHIFMSMEYEKCVFMI